jgi:methyl-accepting chemotaxis protein
MLKDTKIATKLYVGFATLLIVMLCVGLLARQYLATVTEATIEIGNTRIPGMTALQGMANAQLRVGAGVHALANPRMLDSKSRQNNYNEITLGFEALHATRAAYEALTHAPEEAQMWQRLIPVFAAWQREIDNIVATHKNKDALLAQGLSVSDPKVLQLDERANELVITARDSRVESGRILAELTTINGGLGKAAVTGAIASASQGNSWILFAILFGASASIAMSVFIARSVSSAINALRHESSLLTQSAVEGKLTTRGNVAAIPTEFRSIIEGINQTLDAMTGPILEATQVLESLAQYDLRSRVKGEYKGDHARIKHALNGTGTALHDALGQVAEAIEQLSEAAQQIAASSQSVAQGASEQASSLEETSASLEEMSSMTKQNADNTVQARTLAQMTKQAAEKGGVSMTRMTEAMAKIRSAAESTAQIIKDINDIAFQTNLLALNAAVEAARAGEAGRGFAVVAEEVRNLALRSKEAAKKTEDLIRMSVDHAENGRVITDEVAGSLTEIVDAAGKVTDIIGEIAIASQEQSRGIEQVNTAVSEMDKVVQVSAANAEESSSAAEELSSQTEELAGLVARFQLERRAAAVRTRRAPNTSETRVRAAVPLRPPAIRQKLAVGAPNTNSSMNDELTPLHSDVTFKDF